MRGQKLTNGQIETALRVYGETGNACEAARQAGCVEGAVRALLARRGVAKQHDRHARLCDVALQKARKSLRGLGEDVEAFIANNLRTDSLEPRDLAALVKARADLAATIAKIADREDRRRTGLLERQKLRAELAGELVQKHEVAAMAKVVLLPSLDDDIDAGSGVAPEPGPADALSRDPS